MTNGRRPAKAVTNARQSPRFGFAHPPITFASRQPALFSVLSARFGRLPVGQLTELCDRRLRSSCTLTFGGFFSVIFPKVNLLKLGLFRSFNVARFLFIYRCFFSATHYSFYLFRPAIFFCDSCLSTNHSRICATEHNHIRINVFS